VMQQLREEVDFDFGHSEQQPRTPFRVTGRSPFMAVDWGRTTDLAFASCWQAAGALVTAWCPWVEVNLG